MAAVKALQKPNALVIADRLISQEILRYVQAGFSPKTVRRRGFRDFWE
jgi:hypothetical protein